VQCYQADLTLDNHIQELATCLKRDLDRLDVLVHSAGVIALGPIERAPIEEFDWQYRVNVRAPYALTQALLPLIKSCQGQVVFINSSVTLVNGRANLSQYSATKHALKAVADSLRDEVNVYGVRVISVYPGRTASPMQEAVREAEGKPYAPADLIQPDDVAALVLGALALPRTAEVTDIAVRPLRKP
jgi:NAD(P)-dependent dehydrogenase (short-subunit alcohol dehydrogenase family)